MRPAALPEVQTYSSCPVSSTDFSYDAARGSQNNDFISKHCVDACAESPPPFTYLICHENAAEAVRLMGPGSHDDVRLQQLVGAPWVLVEYYEYASGMSMMGMDLSRSIPQTDVLYFRRSGGQAKEPHYDFHVYRDGTPERRVLCHCTHPDGDPQQAWWEGISDDAQTGYEPDDLYDGATQETLLDNAGIDRILQQMDLSIAALFAPTDNMILFSRA